ncbi:hypothetical protein [Herbidospora sp. NBRC 101105]|uniref:hypothetical protein n=1 Tax=Herbidospora sp. NBRC 101105 TaxID=3032195 RepID=UPI0024A3A7AA|nr:hypothetical protein [Herbidospora sp. NBRC 101105]GLX96642.1 hypothetical protein Hesp01_45920 [Herbidospora sp. NBRC 101105]
MAVHGGLDVVYNNAALLGFSIADWHTTIAGELDIPFLVSKFAWPTWCNAAAASSSTWPPWPARSQAALRPTRASSA